MSADWDVVIAGGGPVGTFAARAFARQGFTTLVLESRSPEDPPREDARQVVLALRACRLLATLGSWEDIVAEARPVRHVRVRFPRTSVSVELEASRYGLEALGWTLRYDALVRVLRAGLRDDRRVTIMEGTSPLAALDRGSEGLLLRVRRGEHEEDVNTRLLVVAEGTTPMLPRLGWPVSPPFPSHDRAWIVSCRVPIDEAGTAFEAFVGGGTATLLVVEPGRGVLTLIVPRTSSWAWDEQLSNRLERLTAALGLSRGGLTASNEGISLEVRRGMHSRPAMDRRLILGTSWHALHPFAAQGLLLSWRDVFLAARWLGAIRQQGGDWWSFEILQRFVETRLGEHRLVDAFVHRVPSLVASLAIFPGTSVVWRSLASRPISRLIGYWGMGYGWGRR